MRLAIVKTIGVLFLAILQLAIFNKISILESIPNIIFALSLALCLRFRFNDSFLVAIFGGFLIDLASNLRFGVYTFLFLIILLTIRYVITKIIPAPNFFVAFLIIFSAFLIFNLVLSLFIHSFLWWQIMVDALLNSVLGILLLFALNRITKPLEEYKIA